MSRKLIWLPIAWGVIWWLLQQEHSYGSPVVQAILNFVRAGVILGGLSVAVKCNFTSQWRRSHPGYWLCVIGTWQQVETIYINYRLNAQIDSGEATVALWSTLETVASLRLGILYAVGVAVNQWPLQWRRAFYCLAFGSFASALWFALLRFELSTSSLGYILRNWLLPLIDVATFGLTVAAIYADIKQAVIRDWLHWLGVIYIGERTYFFVRSYLESYDNWIN